MNSFKSFLMLLFLGAVGYGVYRTLHTQSAQYAAPGIDTSTPEIELKIGQQIEFPKITSPDDIAANSANSQFPSPLPIAKSTLTPPPLGVNSQISGSLSPPPATASNIAPSNLNTVAEPMSNGLAPLPSQPIQNPPMNGATTNNTLANSTLPNNSLANNAVPNAATTNVAPINMPTNALAQNPVATQPLGPGLSVSPYPFVREELKPLLAQNKLLEALQCATKMYDDSRLTPQEQKELQDLLNQLAGSVIYSREHLLAKPHLVTNGESLTTIAEKYHIPPGLLAKINGLTNANQLRAGDSLKIIPGPFTADVNLSKKRLTVFVNDCYAGSFELLTLGQDTPKYREQTFVVQHKTDNVLYRNGQVPAGDPKNPLGNFLLALNEDIAIHGVGAEVPPSDPRGSLRLSARDVEDVYDILNVGSRVTLKR